MGGCFRKLPLQRGLAHPLTFNEEQMLRLFVTDPRSMARGTQWKQNQMERQGIPNVWISLRLHPWKTNDFSPPKKELFPMRNTSSVPVDFQGTSYIVFRGACILEICGAFFFLGGFGKGMQLIMIRREQKNTLFFFFGFNFAHGFTEIRLYFMGALGGYAALSS